MSEHPYERPCHGGRCTEKGIGIPGFCKCKEAIDEIGRLRAALRGAIGMVEMLGVPLSYSGQAELDGYRRALAEQEKVE